jgi:hypothetical protein
LSIGSPVDRATPEYHLMSHPPGGPGPGEWLCFVVGVGLGVHPASRLEPRDVDVGVQNCFDRFETTGTKKTRTMTLWCGAFLPCEIWSVRSWVRAIFAATPRK